MLLADIAVGFFGLGLLCPWFVIPLTVSLIHVFLFHDLCILPNPTHWRNTLVYIKAVTDSTPKYPPSFSLEDFLLKTNQIKRTGTNMAPNVSQQRARSTVIKPQTVLFKARLMSACDGAHITLSKHLSGFKKLSHGWTSYYMPLIRAQEAESDGSLWDRGQPSYVVSSRPGGEKSSSVASAGLFCNSAIYLGQINVVLVFLFARCSGLGRSWEYRFSFFLLTGLQEIVLPVLHFQSLY